MPDINRVALRGEIQILTGLKQDPTSILTIKISGDKVPSSVEGVSEYIAQQAAAAVSAHYGAKLQDERAEIDALEKALEKAEAVIAKLKAAAEEPKKRGRGRPPKVLADAPPMPPGLED